MHNSDWDESRGDRPLISEPVRWTATNPSVEPAGGFVSIGDYLDAKRKAADRIEALEGEVERLRAIAREAAESATQHQADVLRLKADHAALRQALEALEADDSKLWPSEKRSGAITAARAALDARQEPVRPGSPEASAMIDSVLAEYNWPSNPKNAARAGFVAAQRMLAARAALEAQPVACIGRGDAGCGYVGGQSGGVCPACGGMLLSSSAIAQAKKSTSNCRCSSKGFQFCDCPEPRKDPT